MYGFRKPLLCSGHSRYIWLLLFKIPSSHTVK